MSNDLTIGVRIDSSGLQTGVKQGTKALDSLDGEVRKVSKDTKVLGVESDRTEQEIRDVASTSNRASQSVAALGRSTERSAKQAAELGRNLHNIQTSGKLLAYGSDKILNSYSVIAGGAGFAAAAKSAVSLRHELVQMGIAARDMTGQVAGMSFAHWLESTHEKILKTSVATGQSADSLTAGMRAIVQRTGNMKQAVDQIELMGQAATATGAAVDEVSALASQLDQKAGVKGVDAMRQALTLFIAQGKTGAFEMRDMVTQGETLMSVLPLFGGKGMEGLKSFGAFIQMARTAVGSGAEAATTIEALGRVMANIPEVEKKLAKVGLHVKLDRNGSMEDNIKRIIIASNGDLKRLTASGAFEREGVRAIQTLANQYASGRGFEMFDQFKSAGGDLAKNTMLMDDFATATNDAQVQMQMLFAQIRSVSDKMLTGTIGGITRFMRSINSDSKGTQEVIRHIIKDLILVASIAGAVKLYKMGREIKDILGPRRGGAAGGVGDALGSTGMAGVQRVFVVNLPGGGMAGIGPNSSGVILDRWGNPIPTSGGIGGASAGRPSAWNRWGRSTAIGAGIAGAGAFDSFSTYGNTPEGWGGAAGSAMGTTVGMLLGGPVGAMIGERIGNFIGVTLSSEISKSVDDFENRKRAEDAADPFGGERSRKFLGKTDATAIYAQRPISDKNSGFLDQFKASNLTKQDSLNLQIINQIAADGSSTTRLRGADAWAVKVTNQFDSLPPGIRPGWAAGGR